MAISKFGSDFGRRLSSLDFWRLCDELSVVQAALLIAGENPSDDGKETYIESWPVERQPPEYRAARTALVHAIIGRRLPARVVYQARDRRVAWGSEFPLYEEPGQTEQIVKDALLRVGTDDSPQSFTPSPDLIVDTDPDVSRTTIMVDALRDWLRGRGFREGFFFPDKEEEASYLNPLHPRYAPKLAATIRAWQAAEGQDAGRSPKTVLAKWLREHASLYGLTDSEGKTNETGIEECAKVANWEPKGGAPRTPDSSSATQVSAAMIKKNLSNRTVASPQRSPLVSGTSGFNSEFLDDECPF